MSRSVKYNARPNRNQPDSIQELPYLKRFYKLCAPFLNQRKIVFYICCNVLRTGWIVLNYLVSEVQDQMDGQELLGNRWNSKEHSIFEYENSDSLVFRFVTNIHPITIGPHAKHSARTVRDSGEV